MTTRTVAVVPGGAAPRRWSASAVDAFESCGLRFWFTRVAGWVEPETEALVLGRVVHAVLEELFRRRADDRQPAAMPGLLEEALARFPAPSDVPVTTLRDAAIQRLRAYLVLEPDPAGVELLDADSVERKVEAAVDGIDVVGYVDRLTLSPPGLTRVSDYKTGVARPEHLAGKLRQQYLYVAALAQTNTPVDEVELLFLGGEPRSVCRPVYPRAVARALDDLRGTVAAVEAALGAGAWPARVSPLCGGCAFRPCCPARSGRAPQPGSEESDQRLTEAGLRRRGGPAVEPPAVSDPEDAL